MGNNIMRKEKKGTRAAAWFRRCCLAVAVVLMAVAVIGERPAEAKKYTSLSQFKRQLLDTDTFEVLGYAYLVGTDNVAKIGSLQTMYSVPAGTKIQGHTIKPDYLPQNNNQSVKAIYTGAVQGGQSVWWVSDYDSTAAFKEYEGGKLQIVAYDDQWVTFWGEGYAPAYDIGQFVACNQDLIQTTHSPGFYRVKRSQVWIDLGRYARNIVPDGEKVNIQATGKVTNKFLGVSVKPGIAKSGDVYRVPQGTDLKIVSTEPIASETSGDSNTYYKIYFNGKNDVNYMTYKSPGYYFVNTKYVNLYKKGVKTPEGSATGKVYKLSDNAELKVYDQKSTDAKVIGKMQNDAQVIYFADESTDGWLTIWFNSQKAYVKAEYVSKTTDVSSGSKVTNMHIKDIVNNQYVIAWDDLYKATNYRFRAVTSWNDYMLAARTNPKVNAALIYENLNLKNNYITLKNSCFKNKKTVDVFVLSSLSNKFSTAGRLTLTAPPSQPSGVTFDQKAYMKKGKLKTKNIITKNSMSVLYFPQNVDCKTEVQYSTSKTFKTYKTLTKSCYNSTMTDYKAVKVKGLKKNTTYYFRQRDKREVKTSAGKKYLTSPWSKLLKGKTKK